MLEPGPPAWFCMSEFAHKLLVPQLTRLAGQISTSNQHSLLSRVRRLCINIIFSLIKIVRLVSILKSRLLVHKSIVKLLDIKYLVYFRHKISILEVGEPLTYMM